MPMIPPATRNAAAGEAWAEHTAPSQIEDLDAPENSIGLEGKMGDFLGQAEGAGIPQKLQDTANGLGAGLRASSERARQELNTSGPRAIDAATPLSELLAGLGG